MKKQKISAKTLRDEFALAAMQAIVSRDSEQARYERESAHFVYRNISDAAYLYADAMLKARLRA